MSPQARKPLFIFCYGNTPHAHVEQKPVPCGPVNTLFFCYVCRFGNALLLLQVGLTKKIGRITWITQSESPGKMIWVRLMLGCLLCRTKVTRAKLLSLHFTWTPLVSNSSGRKHLVPGRGGKCEFMTYCLGQRLSRPENSVECDVG